MTEAIRIGVTIQGALVTQFNQLKEHFGVNANTEMVRVLIRENSRALLDKQETKGLTENEKDHLTAWARDRSDLNVEEAQLGELLLTENQHVWPWLQRKLGKAIEYIFSLKNN